LVEMNAFMLVTQTPGAAPLSHLTPNNSLLPELASLVATYGRVLDDATKTPFTAEEIIWLLQTHKEFTTANDEPVYRVEHCRHESVESLFTESLRALHFDASRVEVKYLSIPIKSKKIQAHVREMEGMYGFEIIHPNALDLVSMFRLLKVRLDRLGYAESIAVTRQHIVKFLSDVFEFRMTRGEIVVLEMYLCANAMNLGLISGSRCVYLKYYLYAPYGGTVSGMRQDDIIAQCHKLHGLLMGAIEKME